MFHVKKALAILAGALVLGAPPARAQAPAGDTPAVAHAATRAVAATAPPLSPAGAHALTHEDLEPWLDGIVPYALARADVAGAVVVVVKDGQVLLQKGYGFSDAARRTPVSPATTMFRTGSIGKLFTWTSVMQLVEQGKLDLDRDVNTYLDFKIPPAFGKPITMRNLLQHTPGFEDMAKYLFVDSPPKQLSIERFLKRHIPARIRPPGEVVAYSNYGATLAGYIMQRVSGEPYAQYVQRHIFDPLGMAHSTLQQPPPASLTAVMSRGYVKGSDAPRPYEIVDIAPAGGAANSGADMARFMLAHLQDGRLGAAQILKPGTAQLMHRQSFQAIPPLPGFALGFYHEDRNGHDIIAHEGDTNYFHSDLELLTRDGVGFFIAVNSLGKDAGGKVVRTAVCDDFIERYFPAPNAPPEPTWKDAKRDAALLAGDYQGTRRSEKSVASFIWVLGQNKIVAAPDGALTVQGVDTIGGGAKHWREVGPYLWRDEQGGDRMAAKVEDGRVKAVWFDQTPPAYALEPVPPSNNKGWILPLLGASLLVLVVTLAAWPWAAWVRRREGRSFAHTGARAHAYRLVRLAVLAGVVGVVGFMQTITSAVGGAALFADGAQDGALRLFQLFMLMGLVGVLAAAWNLATVWRDKDASWWAKLTAVLLLLSLTSLSYVAVHLHLLNPSIDY